MQNAIAMGPLKSLITQIIASHVKLNQLQVTSLKGVEPPIQMDLAHCSKKIAYKKNINNRLVLHKNTPITNKVKTPMHIATKQIQKIPKLQTSTNALKYKN